MEVDDVDGKTAVERRRPGSHPVGGSEDDEAHDDARDVGSRRATRPTDLSRAALVDVARNVRSDLVRDQASLLSAGIAFRAFLALFPALIVAITATALAQPTEEILYQARRLTIGLPRTGRLFLLEQVEDVTRATEGGLRVAFVVSIVLAVWAASSALQGTMTALSTTQGEVDDRTWLQQRIVALKLTAGAIPFVVVSVGVITGVPAWVRRFGLGSFAGFLGIAATLVVLALMMVTALTVLYRVGPSRRPARMRWASPGALLATLLWLAGTELFRLLVENAGDYDARYGALAGTAIIMLWLWLTSWCVLVGATANARLEHQTARDSTVGRPRPLGEREAVPADTHPDHPRPDPPDRYPSAPRTEH